MIFKVLYLTVVILLSFTAHILPAYASPIQYEIIDLDIPADSDSGPWGLNDAGWVVGSFETSPASSIFHAFLWDPNDGYLDLGTLGGNISSAFSINHHSQVTGQSEYSNGSDNHAFFWNDDNQNNFSDPGEIIDLGTLSGNYSSAHDINSAAQVVGEAELSSGYWHPFLWRDTNHNGTSDPGEMIDLGTLVNVSDYAVAHAINDIGQVTGQSEGRAFRWQDLNLNGQSDPCEMIDLGDLGGLPSSWGYDINRAGNVVGDSYYNHDFNITHAFFWSDTNHNGASDPCEMIDLGDLGGQLSHAFALNDANQVVGYSYPADGPFRACMWDSNHNIIDLNDYLPPASDWVLFSEARDINNRGQIVGWGLYDDGSSTQERAFILNPILIKLLDPNRPDVLLADTLYPITWQSDPSIQQVKIEFSSNLGQHWNLIEPNLPNTGAYIWHVPPLDSDQCLIRLSDPSNLLLGDVNDAPFTIYQCPLTADLNFDCRVNLLDLYLFCAQWLQSGDPANCPLSADFTNDDCLVNLPDLALFASQWLD